jgi:hypothetical protein
MKLVFLNIPYREDGAEAQFVCTCGQLSDAVVVRSIEQFILESSLVYDYGWLEVFDCRDQKWYRGTLHYDQSYENDESDQRTVRLTRFEPRTLHADFFSTFTLQQGNNKMVTGQAQEVMHDALRRMENLSAALTSAQQAQIAAQKAATEASKAIDAVMQVQGDVVFLHNLLQQFSGMFGTMDASASGPTEDTPAGLPPVNTEPDPRLPVRGTAGALLGQEPAVPAAFRPTTQAAPARRALPASPALEGLSQAAERMVTELGRHRAAVQAEQAAPTRRGPQEEGVTERRHPGATEDNSQYIGHFAGAHSLFVRFLHPEVTTGGRGFVKPGYAGLKQYKQDISQISADVLKAEQDWLTGFYRNGTTGTRQLFVRLGSAMVLVDNPMMPNNMPLVAFTIGAGPVTWRQIRSLSVDELQTVHDEILAEFHRLEQVDQQLPQARA